MMRQICLYCGTDVGTVDDPGEPIERISHGICIACFPRLLAGTGKSFEDYLDSLPAPVFVVDEGARVAQANKAALTFLSTDLADVQGRLGGEVFSCRHASQPGGCGQTVHCRTCTIRETVMATFETGKPSVRVPAYMDLTDYTGDRRIRFLISTEKPGSVVLLRIEEIDPTESARQTPSRRRD
jgi:PAS domain-containing protein